MNRLTEIKLSKSQKRATFPLEYKQSTDVVLCLRCGDGQVSAKGKGRVAL